MKHLSLISLCALFSALSTLLAAVPIRWQVETSRLQPVQFDCYHGETLELEAAFNSYGKPLAIEGEAALWYQTNGMGATWWSAPATVSSNRIAAAFTPAMDPGAAQLKCFLGGTASTYRAAFTLRFANSPGAAPNVLPLPTATLDFAAVEVANAPWLTAETDPTVPDWAKTPAPPVNTNDVENIVTKEDVSFGPWVSDYPGNHLIFWQDSKWLFEDHEGGIQESTSPNATDINAIHLNFGWIEARREVVRRNTLGLARMEDLPPLTNGIPEAIASQQSQVSQLSQTVNAWQTYWDGDDVRVTITNYYGSADLPHLYIEQKMPADETHPNAWFKTVWDELTRHAPILARLAAVETELPHKADRAWGYYDSANGNYSPDGLLQISHARIQIANDLAYTKQVATGGEVWVLASTEPVTLSGVTSNGFFRITDGDGTPLLEIVKGDRCTVGATAAGITVSASEVTIPYNVISDDHPEVQQCTDLAEADWQPATVTWSGASGAWVAHVARPSGDSAFFKATYETGGETYIKNNIPVGFDRAYIGGRAYNITVDANGFLKVVR